MPSAQFLQGDARGIDPGLYEIPITVARAQAIVDILRRKFLTPRVTVGLGRKTRRRRGFMRRAGGEALITLHPIGLNLGTLFHEFAHVVCPVRGHGRRFKTAQLLIIQSWMLHATTHYEKESA